MKKLNKNKKGFTIVELVIVIAVISILAAVLIPTFSGVIAKANQSACLQEAVSLYHEALTLDLADGTQDAKDGNTTISAVEGKSVTYTITENGVNFSYMAHGCTATYSGSEWTVE